jgi:hypothetical protein
MKRFFFLLLFGLVCSCNDGDLQIETIDFDEISIQTCESTITTASTVFFKISGEEALILELQSGLLKNEVSPDTLISSFPAQSNLVYRIFTGTVNKSYFCDAIPPSEPLVLEEIEAVSGEVLVSTLQNPTDTTLFEHTILLRNVTLLNAQGERITDTSINDFGTVSTKN